MFAERGAAVNDRHLPRKPSRPKSSQALGGAGSEADGDAHMAARQEEQLAGFIARR